MNCFCNIANCDSYLFLNFYPLQYLSLSLSPSLHSLTQKLGVSSVEKLNLIRFVDLPKKHKCKSSIFRTQNDSRAMHFYSTQKRASTFEKVSPIPLPFRQKRRLSRNVTNRRKKADYPDRKCQSQLIIPDKQNYFSLPPKKIDLSDNE